MGGPQRSEPPPSAAGDHGEAFGDAGHVVQDDAQEEEQHARHQDHRAHAGPRGALDSPGWAGDSPLPVAHLQPRPLQPHRQAQILLLRHGHHRHTLVLPAGQDVAPQLPRQAERPLLGDGEGQHVAAVAGEADEHRRVLGGVGDGDDGDDVRVVRELGDGQAGGQFGDAAAPGAANLLLAASHLGQTHGATSVSAVQEFGASPGAVVVEADLALQI